MESRRIGPYIVHEQIGAGGMGAVYKAYDDRLERWVAVKSILPSKELSDERRERLRREAKSAAGLNHPAIAQVFDIISEGKHDHIVMEYVEGQTLKSMLVKGPLPLAQAVDVGRQVAEGLTAAHERGIVHRDLKAENVIVTNTGKVKILDFGLAKRIAAGDTEESITGEGEVIGTSGAMSPEQAEGHAVDQRSDLFSFGTMLYYMVSGQHPFSASTHIETMRRIAFSDPAPARELNREIPEDLSELIEWLHEKNPRKRPKSAHEVVIALETLSQHWTGQLRSTSLSLTSPLMIRRLRRRRWLIAGTVVTIALLTVAGLLLRTRQPAPPTIVAVLKPSPGDDADPDRAPLVADAVRMTALNWVAGTAGLAAPDTTEVDAIKGSPKQIAVAVAADEVLAFKIDDCRLECRLTMRRLGSDGMVIWNESTAVLAHDLPLITRTAATQLSRAYPELDNPEQGFGSIPAEDLESFFRVVRQINNPSPGVTRVNLLADLQRIRERVPQLLEIHTWEAKIAGDLYMTAGDEGYLITARQAIRRALDMAPEDTRALQAAFSLDLATGEIEAARQKLARMEEIAPTNAHLLMDKAKLEQREGNTEAATALLGELVAIRPSWRSYLYLASSELDTGGIESARSHLEEGLRLAPGNRHLKSRLALLELLNGDPGRAAILYAELADVFPETQFFGNMGTAYSLAGEYQLAADAFRQVLEASPGQTQALLGVAEALEMSGELDEAQVWYQRTLQAVNRIEDKSSVEVLYTKAQCYAHLGRPMEASRAMQDALQAAPDASWSYFTAALVNAVIGQTASAISNTTRAIELGVNPSWFDLPWFDQLRDAEEFQAALRVAGRQRSTDRRQP
jgi:serine/threonine-protein kinase